ncbi:N/A [soil metagenome]|jgi:AraC family transcriptional regulator
MQPLHIPFLGNNKSLGQISGCNLALTNYDQKAELTEKHTHEYPSISLLLNGTYHEELAGQRHRRQSGDFKLVEGGQSHRCYNYSANTVKINLEFTPAFFGSTGLSSGCIGDILGSYSNKLTLIKLYSGLCEEEMPVTASVQILLLQLFNKPIAGSASRTMPPWVVQIKALLHDQQHTNFDLNYLSGVLGVHPVTISKWFPHYFNVTLSEYLRLIKLEKATLMLKNTRLSLTEIAYTCGFADQGHFTRTFKATTGFLPKAFRKI